MARVEQWSLPMPQAKETVIDGENGFLVPVKAIEELAEAMEKFIIQPSLIESMGQASQKIATEKFDVQKVNETMIEAMGL